jgi:glycosyltransferase involved in cell wall biosynthesis
MRVGVIVYGIDRPLTGISRYTVELCRGLAALPDRPEILLLCAGPVDRLTDETGFPAIALPGCRLLPGLITLGNIWLPYLARRHRLDIVHDPTGVTPFLFGSGRARVLVTIHDVFPWSIPGYNSRLDTIIYHYWLPYILPRRVDRVITVSQHSQVDIHRYVSVPMERIQVIPEGISPLFRPVPRETAIRRLAEASQIQPPYILFVGSLTRRKNLERALQAFGQISVYYPHLKFVLVGPRTWQQTPIESVIESFHLQNKIILTGPVPDVELAMFYSAAEVFLFPSLYEGFGLPPLEAMACGAPVVTSDISSLPEVVGEAALLVDPYNVEAIANAMQEILKDQDLAQAISLRGLRHVREFTWGKAARLTLDLYQQVYDKP